MNSGQLLRSSSFKITLVVCVGHALLIGWMMTAISNHLPESSAILYGQLVESESNTIQEKVTSPIHAKQDPMNQPDMPLMGSSQGPITNQQPESRSSSVSSAPMSLPSAADPRFNNPKPAYPIASRENGEEGRVWLSLCVSEHGCIIQDCPADHHALEDLERLYGIQLEHLQGSQGGSVLVQVR